MNKPMGSIGLAKTWFTRRGLFQGNLGFTKAIILLEEGCEDFSNIHGLGHISFPSGDILGKGASEKIRHVLEREGLLSG